MKMATKLCALSLLCLAVFVSTTNAGVFCVGGYPSYCHWSQPSSKGNFTAVGTRWEKGSKKGIWGKRVIFDCSTNDPNATVELQYGRLDAFVAGCFFTTKWHDVMKGTSSEYPKGSVIQRGQVFVLKKYRGQRDRFRCMAWSHGKSICRKLGRLSSA